MRYAPPISVMAAATNRRIDRPVTRRRLRPVVLRVRPPVRSGEMLETGTQAPDFTIPNQDGEDVTLSSLRGRPVVLYFYPEADTLDA